MTKDFYAKNTFLHISLIQTCSPGLGQYHHDDQGSSREKMWMKRLRTMQPRGLNIQEGND